MPAFTPAQWALAAVAALCIGLSKSGFSGLGLATVVILAQLFPARESTGVLLPLLICGDCGAVLAFRQHADWRQIWRMLPITLLGVVLGYCLMQYIPDRRFSQVLGGMILLMTALQFLRRVRPEAFRTVPHTRPFAWTMGLSSGVVTMVGNGAGPLMALYFLAINLPKLVFVGTSGWFFLLVNVFKVPFSVSLGLIHGRTLSFNLLLVPAVALGNLSGRWLIHRIPQRVFETLLLLFTTIASLRLMGLF